MISNLISRAPSAHHFKALSAMPLRVLLAALLVGSALVTTAHAQNPVDLTAVNLEDLLKMEVRSVSKKEQQLFRTPAAVYVLTSDEIRRAGMSILPEALRLVPGLHVARIDGSRWAISARGFNGRFANKLLVLVDGRAVYTPVSSGVYWDLQDFPLEDIERIEVVRGPGAAVWGANAVNGVINIITRAAERTQGVLAAFRTGSPDHALVTARYGGAVGSSGFYRVSAKHTQRGELVDESGAPAHDGARLTQVNARVDLNSNTENSWTFAGAAMEGEGGERVNEQSTIGGSPTSSVVANEYPVSSQYALARWTHTRSQRSSFSLQAFWDSNAREVMGNSERMQTADVEFQHRLAMAHRHDVVWGVGQRFWSYHLGGPFGDEDQSSSSRTRLFNAFMQDDIALTARLNLTAGTKFEHNSTAGLELQPTARLAWLPNARQTAWLAVSRAARTPSRIERRILEETLENSDVANEHLNAFEAGYRIESRANLLVDAAVFHNRYKDVVGQIEQPASETPATPGALLAPAFTNAITGETSGLEVVARWQPVQRWRLDASYNWLRATFRALETASDTLSVNRRNPEHQWSIKSWLTLTRSWQLDAMLLYTGRLEAVDVPRYLRADLRLGGPITANIDVSVVGQNLLDARHREFDANEGVMLSEVRRGASVNVTVRF